MRLLNHNVMNTDKKLLFFLATVFFLLVQVPAVTKAQNDDGWKASKETVEKLSKDRSEFNYYEEKVPAYTLPDLFTTSGMKKVTTAQSWTQIRRGEVLEMFRKNVFGRVPETPYQKSFKVVNKDAGALNGTATLKQVDITITAREKTACNSSDTFYTK